jgi:hypothetical protein
MPDAAYIDRPFATSKIGALRDLLLELLQEHERDGTIPTNARFLYYELVQRGQISKVATGKRRADQDLHDALIDIREDGPSHGAGSSTRRARWRTTPAIPQSSKACSPHCHASRSIHGADGYR